MNEPYLAHGVTLTFAWFVAINAAVSAVTALVAPSVLRAGQSRSPRFWVTLRLLPAVTAVFFALALFVPSYWRYEPRESVEGFDFTLTLIAAAGALLVGAALLRGLRAWLGARARIRDWMRHAEPVAIARSDVPAYAIDAPQPMI